MPIGRTLLAMSYPLMRLKTGLARNVGMRPSRLRVLIYHGISPQEEDMFASQLRWLSRSWRFVDPLSFEAIVSGDETLSEDSILLTFDDGFCSNLRVAERVLNPLGIRAIFFVISNYVGFSPKEGDWRKFVAERIYPGISERQVPGHWKNMDFEDLTYLSEAGHCIGCHTASHPRLSQVSPAALEAEIVGSAEVLERRIGTRINHFAYAFGDLASFSPDALAVARRRFKYVHTGLRGNNAANTPSWAIRRDATAPSDPPALLGAFLEGGADLLYARRVARYESWGFAPERQ